jgi:hypothetical protein
MLVNVILVFMYLNGLKVTIMVETCSRIHMYVCNIINIISCVDGN